MASITAFQVFLTEKLAKLLRIFLVGTRFCVRSGGLNSLVAFSHLLTQSFQNYITLDLRVLLCLAYPFTESLFFWPSWLGSHTQTLWNAKELGLIPGSSPCSPHPPALSCAALSFYWLSCEAVRHGKEEKSELGRRGVSLGPETLTGHWFCCVSALKGTGLEVGNSGYPSDHCKECQPWWKILGLPLVLLIRQARLLQEMWPWNWGAILGLIVQSQGWREWWENG